MPELPEVETVRRTLNKLVTGKTITDVIVKLPRLIKAPDDTVLFIELMKGQTIRDVGRRGKFLLFYLDDFVMVSHLRMEGRYGLYQEKDDVEKHTHVIFQFADATELRYKDVRTFGTMHLFAKGKEMAGPPLHKLGPEPLDKTFTAELLKERVKRRKSKIKPLLLNQEIIVGLGNIYVDEALFQAGIHPEKVPDELTDEQWKALHISIVQILSESILLGGSSIKSYVDGQGQEGQFQHTLKAYGRTGEPCVVCGTPIEKFVVGGRGTHICPSCQPRN
ncbi:DNA-formamidopyrimidine glycosylase [Aneurinibacillus aneurinilyticus]|jgi:formamidopyrimidine-DNA glycosylase|uniref:Formamidopyrimidine-DNA glycosylase n=1 Tax=Aneurinibacillus aneurinilyticus ATCC 12856 TaxID=649747 RepID=U1YCU1_ANEAE|nr:DNA-formamidopyrimidine glycosylase [Aneurinibacillus aneurinilyticus]ERI08621.1 DNA-formamidopyrimidine glycosylase [Aneurinibacillus aneurinilyticus ATCC 12856]MCI1693511.1 DNA-formamidopyrimidine glycosylase [Aneurinibacillus aneurinilyticus]MED0672385.1 DNA-formamidopyrimidine glycosylase [Aneurinibacillus aneurinilyticus]MED0706145.1 DNA-formamidopyrimidine glycosylase [Aneurinibacillus aneurinilyticus]MED0725119.1 DNA-formamidopyrimidine glycosylase [Aneurinibacillus aneurinilyticus]